MKANLFNNWFNSVLTIVVTAVLLKTVPPLVKWAFIDSVWFSTSEACRAAKGACWSIIPANIRFIMFGFYPHDQQWRPLAAMLLLFALLIVSRNRNLWKKPLAYAWFSGLFTMGLLMKGGILGLKPVESTQWGGLPLTLLLSIFGLTAAYPLGIALALGRQSKMLTIKTLCIIYIEMIRGVPLISLLFMSAIIFPLFLPEGVTINNSVIMCISFITILLQ
jgi:general L-amino acid transport system permease protein